MIKKITDTLIFSLFTFSIIVLSMALYIRYLWPSVDFEQIINTARDLTLDVIKQSIYPKDILFAFLPFIIIWPIISLKSSTKTQIIVTVVALITTIFLSGYPEYAYLSRTTSTLYETEYVHPKDVTYEFPDKKRNLILIFAESFEQNYSQEQYYGKNLIPNLNHLQTPKNYDKKHISLSGTDYSIAALVTDLCGIPFRLDPNMDIEQSHYFLPQTTCFPEILQKNGYQTEIVKAADIKFTRVNIFAQTHGYNKALGVNELQAKYPELKQKPYLGTFGGINDRALFEYALKELKTLSQEQPFMLTLFTLDTHTPGFFKDPQCPENFNDLRDAITCTDNIISEFVEKIKTMPYYKDTTVVIVGDHLLPTRLKYIKRHTRGIFNVFLNLPDQLEINNQKTFSSLDIAPTILESLNIKMSPRSFGLGRSLFSNNQTLMEKYKTKLNTLVKQQSVVYDKLRTPILPEDNAYVNYELNTTLDNKDCILYTRFYENLFNINYLDRMNFLFTKEIQSDLLVNLKFNAISDEKPIIIKANKVKLFEFYPPKNVAPPFDIKFTVSKKLIRNNKLQLIFKNTKGVRTVTQMGIAPLFLTISEK